MIKIATWNLKKSAPGSPTASRQLEHIAKQDADIWIFTESHESLAPGPNYHSAAQSSQSSDNPDGYRWVSVWTRGTTVERLTTSDPDRTACALIKLTDTTDVLVYGTVLPWLGSTWRTYPAKDGEAFLASLATQESDLRSFATQHSNAIVCYGGDFNQDLNNKHYYGSARTKDALDTTLKHLGLTCRTCDPTDPVTKRTSGEHANIDHICLSKKIAGDANAWPDNHSMLKGLSDHFGIAVTILSQ